jgi:hypothetical protein
MNKMDEETVHVLFQKTVMINWDVPRPVLEKL